MLDEARYDLIDRFFNNELSDAEHTTFELLLSSDMEFREEVKLQRSLIGGIQAHGKEELKKELGAIYLTAKPEIEKQKYKTQAQRNFWKRILKWLGLATALCVVIFFAIRHQPKAQGIDQQHEGVAAQHQDISGTEEEQLETSGDSSAHVHRDTVWHVIQVQGGKKGDTINVYSAKEAKSEIRIIERRDTLKVLNAK